MTRRRRQAVRTIWSLVGAIVAILFVKFFIADLYRVKSGSMRPTIFGGPAELGGEVLSEWILVRYVRSPRLERFDLVVARAGLDVVVKRVAGLPGERVRISDGDLLIDGKRLDYDVPRPSPITVFDDRFLRVEDNFAFKRGPNGPWRDNGTEWVLDAVDVPIGWSEGMLLYTPEIRDGYIDQNGERVNGLRTVNDALLECEFAIDQPNGRLRFQLVEKGDTFEVRIRQSRNDEPDASHVVELVRRTARSLQSTDPARHEELLASAPVDVPLHGWQRFSFSNVDNHLAVHLPDLGFALPIQTYQKNELHPASSGPALAGDQSVGPRVGLGGERIRARFRAIRILRDLHHTSWPEDGYGIASDVQLAPNEVFLLGDNSVVSSDSRRFGPVSLRNIIGRPLAVVWPLSRARSLGGAKPERTTEADL